ncbi:Protein FAM69C [Aphelenchoides besseyi]|nr:Protein FAM69C [Aphelenchoides besseyi]
MQNGRRLLIDNENADDEEESVLDLCCGCESSPFRALMFSKRTCLFVSVFLLVSTFLIVSALHGKTDNTVVRRSNFNQSRTDQIMVTLCNDYAKGILSGNLCESLCSSRNWSVVDFHQGASKRVLRVNTNGTDIILKATHDFFSEYEDINEKVDESELTDKVVEMVNDRTSLGWPLQYKSHLIKTLWPSFNNRKRGPQLSTAARNSLWALLQQDEFITLSLLPLSRVTTKTFGSCGHFYAVDTLLPFHMKGYYMGLKAKILVHLMGTLKLFYEFLNEPLQWCDVKFENLGLSAQYPKRFVVMDSDMLYTDSQLNKILTSRQCELDSDCTHFDCISKCNNSTGFCTPRVNDNVDVFCQKLIGRLFGTYWSKSNRYLAACHDTTNDSTRRLNDLRLVWSWSLSDV